MDTIQKFSSDVEKIKKSSETQSAEKVIDALADLLVRAHPDLSSLALSFSQYWVELAKSEGLSASCTEKLCALHALLEGKPEFTASLSQKDWKELCSLTGFEAEDIPLEALNSLMAIFVEKRAL